MVILWTQPNKPKLYGSGRWTQPTKNRRDNFESIGSQFTKIWTGDEDLVQIEVVWVCPWKFVRKCEAPELLFGDCQNLQTVKSLKVYSCD